MDRPPAVLSEKDQYMKRWVNFGWLCMSVCLLSFSMNNCPVGNPEWMRGGESGEKHYAFNEWKAGQFFPVSTKSVRQGGPVPQLVGQPYIIIDKSDYELRVYDDAGWFATYPAVFGNKSLGDKMMEGDRKTPEGVYKIVSKRPHEKWNKILLIDYPTAADWEKFRQRKAKGLIPSKASIGGGIGIHGTWKRDEMVVDYYQNWTNGCISIKNEEIEELYAIIPVGTKVIIQK